MLKAVAMRFADKVRRAARLSGGKVLIVAKLAGFAGASRIAGGIFVAVAALAAPQAAAYEQVCMYGKAGIGYSGRFRVVWGAPGEDAVWRKSGLGFPYEGARFAGGFSTGGATDWSEDVRLGVSRCVDLAQVPEGGRFVAQFEMNAWIVFAAPHLCVGWDGARRGDKVGVFQKSSARRGITLFMDAWGSKYDPYCRPTRRG